MPDVLILYASKHGHTEKVATRMADALAADGVTTHVHDAATPAQLAPHDYDAVIVGGSVHAGHHQRAIVDWAKAHRTSLSTMPSASRCA
jgi:menaquinone-dependent protoporphyrinogen oxidase